MGNVTVSLEESAEQKLRAIANQKYKNKKGALSRVITEALDLYSKQSARQRAMDRQFKWMDEGFEMGKIQAEKREDLYDRR